MLLHTHAHTRPHTHSLLLTTTELLKPVGNKPEKERVAASIRSRPNLSKYCAYFTFGGSGSLNNRIWILLQYFCAGEIDNIFILQRASLRKKTSKFNLNFAASITGEERRDYYYFICCVCRSGRILQRVSLRKKEEFSILISTLCALFLS
jgi:hypothetical protein